MDTIQKCNTTEGGQKETSYALKVFDGASLFEMKAMEGIKQGVDQLSSLRLIDKAIIATNDLGQILEIVLDQVHEQLTVDAASIYLVEPVSQQLYAACGRGYTMQPYQRSGVAEIALNTKRMFILDIHSNGNEQNQYIRSFLNHGIAQCISVPMVSTEGVVGVLEGYYKTAVLLPPAKVEFLETIAGQAVIALEHVNLNDDYHEVNQKLSLAHEGILVGWAKALEYKDRETKGHSDRVTEMTSRVGSELNFSEEEMVNMRWGALLHDIGKMAIPDTILFKPGPLNEEEWEIMRQHPLYAQDFLKGIDFLKGAMDIPLYHHERWNGAGYPFQLIGVEIPLSARIFAMVDVWDALSYDRPYRKAWAPGDVINYIKLNSGVLFDPDLTDLFIRQVKEFNRENDQLN